MLSVALLLLSAPPSINDDVPRPIPEPTPFVVVPVRPIIELDEAAVATMASLGTTPAAELEVYVPTWCVHCKAWAADLERQGLMPPLTDGAVAFDGELKVTFYLAEYSFANSYPFIFRRDTNTYKDNKQRTWEDLRAFAGLPRQRAMRSEHRHAGTLNVKGIIDGFIAGIEAFAGSKADVTLNHAGKGWLELGPAAVLIPSGCKATYQRDATSARLTFSGAKPRIRLLKAIDQPIAGVVYQGGKLTLDFDSWVMPDVELDVK